MRDMMQKTTPGTHKQPWSQSTLDPEIVWTSQIKPIIETNCGQGLIELPNRFYFGISRLFWNALVILEQVILPE
jgi:hypothetical protein